jgi:glutathione-regulated potassium-efflux system ancillary protein KefG
MHIIYIRPLLKVFMSKPFLVLFAHPLFEKSRVNRTLARAIKHHEQVTFHDLYETYPEFNIDIDREKKMLLQHEFIIWHHPFYWYSCPPLLKQWIDMVLEIGWAYGPGGNALQGKKILQVITTGGPQKAYSNEGSNRFTIRQFLAPFEQTARLCKMHYLPPFVCHGSHRLSDGEIKMYAETLLQTLDMLLQLSDPAKTLEGFDYMSEYLNNKTV